MYIYKIKIVQNKLAYWFLDAIIDSNHSSSKLKRDREDDSSVVEKEGRKRRPRGEKFAKFAHSVLLSLSGRVHKF